MKKHQPITGKPNIQDDDPVNRGISGQCLFGSDMDYDPASGKRTGGMEVNMTPAPQSSHKMKKGMGY